MSSTSTRVTDHRPTVVAVSVLAYVLSDVLHEGLGHGVTAWLSGANHLTMSSVALQSDIDTRWISANGTLVNLFFAGVLWLVLSRSRPYPPVTRYFLVMALASNLFTGTGYFFFSGVTGFGDCAAVIQGRQPHWIWRVGLVALGVLSYYASTLLVAFEMRPYLGRLRTLAWTPYVAEGMLAGLAGLLNPLGLFYVIASALPSTLGANAGLLALPGIMRGWSCPEDRQAAVLERSLPWIIAGVLAGSAFIFVLGRGVSWSR